MVGFIAIMFIAMFLLGLKSQKGSAPGLVDGRLAPTDSKPNCVSSEAETQPKKKVAHLEGSLDQAKSAICKTGGIITTETNDYVAATYMSKIFKFVDDVELRDAGDGIVHIRSASRVGHSDYGTNKKRAASIRAAL